MKRFLLFAAFLTTLLFCGCEKSNQDHKDAAKDDSTPKTLVMATNAEFPPYEYLEGEYIDGIDPAIVRTIAKRLSSEVKIDNMKFDSVIAAVRFGKADIAASGLTVTEDRKRQVLFSIPYMVAEQLIIVPENSPIKAKADLKGKRVGVQLGTTGDTYMTKNIQQPERFDNGALAVSALVAGKLDAVVIDNEPAKIYVRKNPGLKILAEPLTTEFYAFAFNKENTDLCKKFNAELKKMKESGELTEIIRKYKPDYEEPSGEYAELAETVEKEAQVAVEKAESGEDQPSFIEEIKQSFYLNFVKDRRYMYLVRGFLVTLEITVFAVLIGIVIGFLVAIVRSTADQTRNKSFLLKFLDCLCKIYLTVIRGTPVVVQLLIIYFVIFGAVDVNKVLVAIIAFGINSGAYVAEIFRAGIMSIDRGQMEAGRSLGLSYAQTMQSVIVPQAFKNVLPALGNELIVLLKETSVAGYIALQDLTKGGDIIRSQTYDAFLPLIAVALIYLAVVMLLTYLLGRLERRLKTNE